MNDLATLAKRIVAHNDNVPLKDDQFAGVPDIGRLFTPKKKQLIEDFTTTVQDIEICVMGEYTEEEKDCNYRGGYSIDRIWLSSDPLQQDIQAWFSDEICERIGCEGDAIMKDRADYGEIA